MCKRVGESCLEGFKQVKETRSVTLEGMRGSIAELLALSSSLEKSLQKNTESIGDLVEGELAAMDKAIEEAAKKMEVNTYNLCFILLIIFIWDISLRCTITRKHLEKSICV